VSTCTTQPSAAERSGPSHGRRRAERSGSRPGQPTTTTTGPADTPSPTTQPTPEPPNAATSGCKHQPQKPGPDGPNPITIADINRTLVVTFSSQKQNPGHRG
jgi:hypothetical protein